MNTLPRITRVLTYLAVLGLVLAIHAYALHLDETSETEPAPLAQRRA
ncbi:hypothetical protein LMG19089_03736 [Ralstonia edaphis]|nr:hypothetical protein LMG19089_03736 [Ralstonia sp. LMG 6871]